MHTCTFMGGHAARPKPSTSRLLMQVVVKNDEAEARMFLRKFIHSFCPGTDSSRTERGRSTKDTSLLPVRTAGEMRASLLKKNLGETNEAADAAVRSFLAGC